MLGQSTCIRFSQSGIFHNATAPSPFCQSDSLSAQPSSVQSTKSGTIHVRPEIALRFLRENRNVDTRTASIRPPDERISPAKYHWHVQREKHILSSQLSGGGALIRPTHTGERLTAIFTHPKAQPAPASISLGDVPCSRLRVSARRRVDPVNTWGFRWYARGPTVCHEVQHIVDPPRSCVAATARWGWYSSSCRLHLLGGAPVTRRMLSRRQIICQGVTAL